MPDAKCRVQCPPSPRSILDRSSGEKRDKAALGIRRTTSYLHSAHYTTPKLCFTSRCSHYAHGRDSLPPAYGNCGVP
jgi:hypothetical protein